MAGRSSGLKGRTLVAVAMPTSLSAVASSTSVATAGPDVCELEEGELTIGDLPASSSVILCDAVGRVVTHDGTGVTVPEPGTAVSVEALTADGEAHGFTWEATSDGKVSYDLAGENADTSTAGSDVPDSLAHPVTPQDLSQESDSADADASDADANGVEVADVDALGSPGACSDRAYKTNDQKEYGTYKGDVLARRSIYRGGRS